MRKLQSGDTIKFMNDTGGWFINGSQIESIVFAQYGYDDDWQIVTSDIFGSLSLYNQDSDNKLSAPSKGDESFKFEIIK